MSDQDVLVILYIGSSSIFEQLFIHPENRMTVFFLIIDILEAILKQAQDQHIFYRCLNDAGKSYVRHQQSESQSNQRGRKQQKPILHRIFLYDLVTGEHIYNPITGFQILMPYHEGSTFRAQLLILEIIITLPSA